ncbi:MAG: SRPBCC domain-containing protein [Bacteroidetes bacterium]|nr:SRPBCC domain-containing protein [Bacteroidota bacterium]
MSQTLLFDFIVNKETSTVQVTREFSANLDLVWEAWTNPEYLDQWWAPKPWASRTSYMHFKVGGRRFYAMVGPEGQEHWSVQEYTSITPKTNFKMKNAFADKDENMQLPGSDWDLNFQEKNGITKVSITIYNESKERMEEMLKMGFQGGFTMCLDSLEQYFKAGFMLRQQNKTSNAARVCTYLNFPGNTEEAFLFYKSVFKSEFGGKGLQRFGDIPAESGHPPVAEEIKKMILHVELPILGGHVLMATDAPPEMGFTLNRGNNMHICLEPETREEAKRLFDALSAGGHVTMPLQDMFFGAYFGELSDKFGINWMISYTEKK